MTSKETRKRKDRFKKVVISLKYSSSIKIEKKSLMIRSSKIRTKKYNLIKNLIVTKIRKGKCYCRDNVKVAQKNTIACHSVNETVGGTMLQSVKDISVKKKRQICTCRQPQNSDGKGIVGYINLTTVSRTKKTMC